MSKNRIVVAGLLLAALVVALIIWRRDGSGPAQSGGKPVAAKPQTQADLSADPRWPKDVAAPSPSLAPTMVAANKIEQAEAHYREFAVYPRWSRPAAGAYAQMVEWNAPRVVDNSDFARDAAGNLVRASLTLDKLYAKPGEKIVATVKLWVGEPGDPQKPLDASVVGSIHYWDDNDFEARPGDGLAGHVDAGAVTFRAAKGAVNEFTAEFAPSEFPKLVEHSQAGTFIAKIRVPGPQDTTAVNKPLTMAFTYAAEEPVVVINKVADRVANGSLEVTFDVDVRQPGPILVLGTLRGGPEQTPIAIFDDYVRPTSLGRQKIVMTFFGRILREAGLPGPYTVEIHGITKNEKANPWEQPWRDDRRFPTAAYQATDFSGDEYNGTDKAEQLEMYRKMREDFAAGRL